MNLSGFCHDNASCAKHFRVDDQRLESNSVRPFSNVIFGNPRGCYIFYQENHKQKTESLLKHTSTKIDLLICTLWDISYHLPRSCISRSVTNLVIFHGTSATFRKLIFLRLKFKVVGFMQIFYERLQSFHQLEIESNNY